jgi:hypothetical protein
MSKTDALGKCLADGEPLKVKHKIAPVMGSVREVLGGIFQGEEIKNAERTGTCPNCGAHVKLSSKGFITAHAVRNAPQPVSKALSDTALDVADTGARVGDPEAAAQRRTVEVTGAFEAGTVKVPVKGENGRTKLQEAPGTEENVRAAFDYWTARKPRSESARVAQNRNVTELSRRLDAMRKARTVVLNEQTDTYGEVARPVDTSMGADMPDAAQAHRGPTLVRGRAETRVRDWDTSWDENTATRRRGTMDQPLGRERFDRKITDVPEPKRRRTNAERRRYRAAQQKLNAGRK